MNGRRYFNRPMARFSSRVGERVPDATYASAIERPAPLRRFLRIAQRAAGVLLVGAIGAAVILNIIGSVFA